jgi:DNA repair photolyase
VLAHWSSIKPAFRVALADGTELIASGDHRFLTEHGWKHVTGAQRGHDRRPHLTLSDALLGTGGFVEGPRFSDDYERGYLSGMIRGDANLGVYADSRPGRRTSSVLHRCRLAPADHEALDRTEQYLLAYGVCTTRFVLDASRERHRPMRAIRTQTAGPCDRIRDLIGWPLNPCEEWRKGFLAGIFDAGGSGNGVLRIANDDATILNWIEHCLASFGFMTAHEGPNVRGARGVRLRGGLRERLRFVHLVDPTIRRKLDIDGMALKSDANTRVTAIEPLGETMRLYDITTGTGDFIANGVVSHNCFARPTHKYLGFDAGADFEREIVVKVNAPEVVRAELRRPSWKGEHVAMGTNTDPYQWVESRYKLMPGIWEAFRDARNPCSILTKSPLLLRDIEVMKEIAAVTQIHANLSIPTLDAKAWRATEPHTPHPRARLEAVAELNRAGIPTGVLIAPLMPGVNDAPEQVQPLLEAAAAAGATGIGGIALHLRGDVRKLFFDWLRADRPELLPLYEKLYARGAYAPVGERRRLAELVRREETSWPSRFGARSASTPDKLAEAEARDAQTKLF